MSGQFAPSSLLYIFPFPALIASESGSDAFPYSQPPATQLLILLSFLFFLNVVRIIADYLIHGGIIAEICLGMVYGAPLANILPTQWESTFMALGYLGLVGIVFEGGLSTNLPLLLSNLPLSTICALTGIILPIAFSFALLGGAYGYHPLEAFAAGAALSSTSLGTTLMALNSVVKNTGTKHSKSPRLDSAKEEKIGDSSCTDANDENDAVSLQQSRIGTVLISAAVIDDVIGLVLSSLIPALSVLKPSDQRSSNLAWTIMRPLLSSFLMASITPLVARFILRPAFWFRNFGPRWCAPRRAAQLSRNVPQTGDKQDQVDDGWTEEHSEAVKVTLMILFVSAISSIAYYTGSSVLFGAYLAGLTLPYMSRPTTEIGATPHSGANYEEQLQALSFEETYKRIITPLQQYILAPLFFASIGYAIPFLSLWKPSILWRGVVYAALMCFAKLAVGFPIAIWTVFPPGDSLVKKSNNGFFGSWIPMLRVRRKSSDDAQHSPNPDTETATEVVNSDPRDGKHPPDGTSSPSRSQTRHASVRAAFPSSAFMGIAMVARGEIGLLIAQIARIDSGSSSATNRGLLGEEAFLVCIWAILLCTLIGPVGLGFVIRRWGKAVHQGIWR